MYFEELIKKNGHKLVRYNEGIEGHTYMKIFDYSVKYGGTVDSFKYYNDYYVDVTGRDFENDSKVMGMKKWFLEVVQDFDGSYYANLTVNAMPVKGLPEYVDYNTLRNAIKEKTGIEILKKKDMLFQQEGRKRYAYIDATQEREDCRVTFDEMKQGWRPKFDAVSITVYKDVLGYQDENDNLTEIAVPKKWLKDVLKSFGEDDFGLWRNVYTADDTITIAQKALQEGVILACADENIKLNGLPSLEDIKNIKQIIVSNIRWDAPKSANLPKQVVVDINEDNVDLLEDIDGYADNLCDFLSDEYGWCIEGFVVNTPMDLDDAIAVARDISEAKKMNSAEKQIENER